MSPPEGWRRHLGAGAVTSCTRSFWPIPARNLTGHERLDAEGRGVGERKLAIDELHHVLVPVIYTSEALRSRSIRRPRRLETQLDVLRGQKLLSVDAAVIGPLIRLMT